MKKILFAFSMLVMTLPSVSFANEEVALPAAEEFTSEELEARHDDGRRDRDWRRPRWPRHEFVCVAQNRFRQRFVGRDWNVRQAQREALMQCQRRGWGGRFMGCHLVGCRRTR